jgi:hypothetical protein
MLGRELYWERSCIEREVKEFYPCKTGKGRRKIFRRIGNIELAWRNRSYATGSISFPAVFFAYGPYSRTDFRDFRRLVRDRFVASKNMFE